MKRIGIDAGGTFTDAVLWDEETGLVSSTKVSSRRGDPAGAVLAAAQRVVELAPEDERADIRDLVHGTTIGTNLSLERNGPRIALMTTHGFRDILEIGRLTRPAHSLYDLLDTGAAPLVARRDRFEVIERLDGDGTVVTALDEESVRAAVRAIVGRGITSVAVCFLYSYLDDTHERRTAEIIADEAPGLAISLSCDVMPQVREYERTSTTVLNAYLKPVCAPYLAELEDSVETWKPDVRTWIMQSNGGVTSTDRAAETPVNLLLSGPSGGVVAARSISRQTGLRNTITVDMGGTSFDVCLVSDHEIPLTTTSTSMDLPVQVPTVDIETIGTGGGSIAHVDPGGQFLVGPASAGAMPGPAAYGRGGTEPTVTDANVVLGILADGTVLGDDVVIDRAAALAACEALGLKLGLSAVETALGIRRISTAAMAGAVRAMSVGKGHDPRTFAMNAFGGAGPMHAADIALELSIPTLVVPPVAGVLSAVGLVVSDVVHNHASSFMDRLSVDVEDCLARVFGAMTSRASAELTDDGVANDGRSLVLALDLHYAGQNSSITVPVGDISARGWTVAAAERFHAMHEKANGFRVDTEPIDIVVARVSAVGLLTDTSLPPVDVSVPTTPVPSGSRDLMVSDSLTVAVPRYIRENLRPGDAFTGAAIVDSANTTVVIPDGSVSRIDGYGNLLIDLKGQA
ncbi:hydantoinase/oxoprolinase family protein [Rhodococcoides kyotonense]|uniref:N-methylhydantoinase A n=1 Tax=Rhodococcoides kyotonense TaxID=398843 RepID=A0A239K0E2_9NOCA|nr:hydantoinase/oxoprolinase family protein [Rhodococcus kyotonensis]SNT10524.1 N-methylhydantoinase A [Rhodococcus kyotonensis]